jgi:CheY-like chemotaxis protein
MSADDPILLVEDNPDDVVFMKRAIRQAGILQPFSIAEHGQDAIDYLSRSGRYMDQASPPVPRLIFLDLKLPYKSGLEVLQWIRAHDSLKTIPVIILTTSAEASDVERAYCLGANAYLVKPANMSELTNILRAFKAFWVDYNLFPERAR